MQTPVQGHHTLSSHPQLCAWAMKGPDLNVMLPGLSAHIVQQEDVLQPWARLQVSSSTLGLKQGSKASPHRCSPAFGRQHAEGRLCQQVLAWLHRT